MSREEDEYGISKEDAEAIIEEHGSDPLNEALDEDTRTNVGIALYVLERCAREEAARQEAAQRASLFRGNRGDEALLPWPSDADGPLVNTKGPGDPNCAECGGSGVILQKLEVPPVYESCTCVYYKLVLRNTEKGWPGLTRAHKLPKGTTSPLETYWNRNLWVTASTPVFKAHLRWLAIRRPPTWFFRVKSDSDLATAWLASVALKGATILDPDAASVSLSHLTLVDLVEPPTLLVLHLGVKTASNKEMANVLLEALRHRAHIGKPTWVWDQWGEKSITNPGHRCYSPEVEEYLGYWKHVKIGKPNDGPDGFVELQMDMEAENQEIVDSSEAPAQGSPPPPAQPRYGGGLGTARPSRTTSVPLKESSDNGSPFKRKGGNGGGRR